MKYMELLKKITTKITFQTFQKALKLRITKNIKKTIREEEQAQYDGDSDHVIDDETSF